MKSIIPSFHRFTVSRNGDVIEIYEKEISGNRGQIIFSGTIDEFAIFSKSIDRVKSEIDRIKKSIIKRKF